MCYSVMLSLAASLVVHTANRCNCFFCILPTLGGVHCTLYITVTGVSVPCYVIGVTQSDMAKDLSLWIVV